MGFAPLYQVLHQPLPDEVCVVRFPVLTQIKAVPKSCFSGYLRQKQMMVSMGYFRTQPFKCVCEQDRKSCKNQGHERSLRVYHLYLRGSPTLPPRSYYHLLTSATYV